MNDKELLEKSLSACEWIGNYVLTAKDGGNAWCTVRKYPKASDWAKTLREVHEEVKKRNHESSST